MTNVPKEAIEKLTLFQQEVSKLFKFIFAEKNPQEMINVEEKVNLQILIDVYETKESVIVEAELADIKPHDLTISISDDVLVLSGVKREKKEDKNKFYYHCMERDFGRFNRVVKLPACSDTNNVEAHYKSGLLKIYLPKIQERRGSKRTITVVED